MKEIPHAICTKGKFKENVIIKPHLTDRLGLRLIYPEGSECILYTNGKKYFAVCEAFGIIFTVDIPKNLGDDVWARFMKEYEGNYSYRDI
jgi:hypothetical protein